MSKYDWPNWRHKNPSFSCPPRPAAPNKYSYPTHADGGAVAWLHDVSLGSASAAHSFVQTHSRLETNKINF